MTTPDEQDRTPTHLTGALPGHSGTRWWRRRWAPVAALAAMLLSVAATPALAGPVDAGPAPAADTPGQSASASEWQDWSADLFAEARSTDWAAASVARGCELISVDIVSTTVPEGTFAGAPDRLEMPVVERAEDCAVSITMSGSETAPQSAFATASTCRSTSGPGTICLSRSGGWLTASFTYRGSGSIDGFIRIYERSSSSGCGTGSTLGTSSEASYSNGTTRSVSSYQSSYDHYSASFWKDVWYGHSNLGTVCRTI